MCPKCGSDEVRLQMSFRFTRLKGAEQVCVCGHRWPEELPDAVKMIMASHPLTELVDLRNAMRRSEERRRVKQALRDFAKTYATAHEVCDQHGIPGGRKC